MLKAGTKRKRTKAEMEEFKLEQILKEEEDRDLRRRVALLEQKVVEERDKVVELQGATDILTRFNEQGLILQDPDGEWQVAVPQKPQERVDEQPMPGFITHA